MVDQAYFHRTHPDTPTYRCPHCSAVVEDQTAHQRWHEALEAPKYGPRPVGPTVSRHIWPMSPVQEGPE